MSSPRFFRRRRVLVPAGAVLVLLLAGSVVADRVVGRQIQHRLTTALECVAADRDGAPIDVQVNGSPALVQLAQRTLDTVTVTGLSASSVKNLGGKATDSTSAGETVLGSSPLTLELHDVGLRQPVTFGSARVSTVVSWSAMQAKLAENSESGTTGGFLSGSGLTLGANGDQLSIDKPDAFMGRSLRVLLSVSVGPKGLTLTPETLRIGDRQIRADLVGGLLSSALSSSSGSDLLAPRTVALPLPAGLSLASATVQPDGLAVSLDVSPDSLTTIVPIRGSCA